MTSDEEIFVVEHATDPAKRLVYAPLRSYLAVFPVAAAEVILQNQDSRLRSTFHEFLKQRTKIDMREVSAGLHKATPELSLAITDNCNLRCVYCHASAGEPHKKRTMSKQLLKAALDKYFEFIGDAPNVTVNFNGGGEPTFAFEELRFAVAHAKDLAGRTGKRVAFRMATNGCYGDHIRAYIVENFSTVSLSFDGPSFIHDKHRPMANGLGSYSYVFDTAKYFTSHMFPFAFRATVSSFSLPYLQNIVDLISEEFPGKGIGLEHLNPFGRGEKLIDIDVASPDQGDFARAITALLDYAKDKKVRVMNAATTEYHLLRPVFCSNVGIPNWTVTVTGSIVACGRDNAPDQFEFGRFDEDSGNVLLDDTRITALRSMNVLEYPECENCFCKYHCAGDCPDRRLADKFDCSAIRHIAKQVLTNIVEGSAESIPKSQIPRLRI